MPILPTQPNTLAILQAMQSLILSECLVGGVTPFAALSAADAARYGVTHAVFVGQPKDFADAYLPQCAIWLPPDREQIALLSYAGRVEGELEVTLRVSVDSRADWHAAEQQILSIRDALWPVLMHHEQLGGTLPAVIESEARPGRGLCYEQIAGTTYRCYEVLWYVRQQWTLPGGRVL